jgi:hypothetical protein
VADAGPAARPSGPDLVLTVPQARILKKLLPSDPRDPPSEWPVLRRLDLRGGPGLGDKQGSRGNVYRALFGIREGDLRGKPHLGLVECGLVEMVTTYEGRCLLQYNDNRVKFRITAAGVRAFVRPLARTTMNELKQPRTVEENSIPYEDAVNRLQQLARTNWEIGEIADCVEPKYGEETLQQLAKENRVEYKTLLNCRAVWRAWPESSQRREDVPWAVHAIFAAQPDRLDLIRQGEWTTQLARREVRRRRVEAHESWLRTIVKGLAVRCAAEPPGSPMSPHTPGLDPINDFDHEFEGEDDSEGGSEDDAEADEEDDVSDPWLFTRGNEKVGDKPFPWNVPVFDTCPARP